MAISNPHYRLEIWLLGFALRATFHGRRACFYAQRLLIHARHTTFGRRAFFNSTQRTSRGPFPIDISRILCYVLMHNFISTTPASSMCIGTLPGLPLATNISFDRRDALNLQFLR